MTIKQIDQILEEGESLKTIAQSFSEIASIKIKRIRSEVERNRIFFEEIHQIYALLKKLAIEHDLNISKPKKMVSLVLTSNYRFYGAINMDVLKFFTTFTKNLPTDRIVLGKAAIDYFRVAAPIEWGSNYYPVLLKDDMPSEDELRNLSNILKDYDKIFVFHSRLKSLLVQQPTVTDISASSVSEQSGNKLKKEDIRFIFEPELARILAFFDSSIINLLLEGTFLESALSRTASRFISMDNAENEANKFISEYQKLKAYAKRNMDNNIILENYASMMTVERKI